jgi:hypothetical protein
MAGVSIKVPGEGGKIEARALRTHRAVVAEWDRTIAAKRPKPEKPARRTFPHIRDYRDVIK